MSGQIRGSLVPHIPRFSYVKYDEQSVELQKTFRNQFEAIEATAMRLPDGRYKSLLLTALEEAYAWSGKAVRDAQVARTGAVDEQPKRNNE